MDVQFIFKKLSQKLLADFEISSQVFHPGVKGDFREDSLVKFLEDGKLPQKYGIGSGLIVSPSEQESNQSDLIIYDRHKCPAWMFSERVQVFPIEGIYGIIEVKSRLSKANLLDGLAKIERLRSMVPKRTNLFPFGMTFGYHLDGNSLDSLKQNLIDYQKEKPTLFRPNLVVVLEEGVIFQLGRGLNRILRIENFTEATYPEAFWFKKDTLFEFYSALFSILSTTHLEDVDVANYRDLPKRVGNYLVKNHIGWQKGDKIYALSETFINKIFVYCQRIGKKTIQEILLSEFGVIPSGSFTKDYLLSKAYYYDPENLPGIHQVKEPFKMNERGIPIANQRMKSPGWHIEIDNETYYFPTAYVHDEVDNLTEVAGRDLENFNFR